MTKLFDHMKGPWVVTYEIRSRRGLLVAEFYRGERAECERIGAASSVGEDDELPTEQPWKAMVGPASFWESFIEQKVAAGEYVIAEHR